MATSQFDLLLHISNHVGRVRVAIMLSLLAIPIKDIKVNTSTWSGYVKHEN